MAIRIEKAGIATTIQDLGRPGYFHLGIPMGGAMDRFALRCANLLVGNDEGAACLESVFVGPAIVFEANSVIAVTGAEIPFSIDDTPCETWKSYAVKAGQSLKFDYLSSGARIYISIAGGINVPIALDSRSTYPIGALGGYKGRAILSGDKLPIGKATEGSTGKSISSELRNRSKQPAELRVLPGLYWHRITEESKASFYDDEWKVAPEADRMGYRFCGGRPLKFVEKEQPFGSGSDPSNIVDSCYPYGSIQVPGGKEPIILHRDAVSGGGYFMVGAVISADMDLIGQMQPHTPTKFVKVTMEQALDARANRKEILNKIRSSLT